MGFVMNNLKLKSVLFATLTIASICLVGCEKPATVVAVPVAAPAPAPAADPVVVTVPVAVPGPAGAPGEKGDKGNTGNTGKTGDSNTTIIVEPPAAPAPAN